jgi:3-dehydroquinate dehydratase/shikimate dehydrogenase
MNTLLFGVVVGTDLKVLDGSLALLKPFIDGIELRLDYFTHIDREELKAFIHRCGLPVMLTVRRKDQGGFFLGSEEERLKLLEALCDLEPAYIDLEYDVRVDYRKKLFETYPKISFLSSFHDFSETPSDLEEVYQKVKTPYAHIFKIAVRARSSLDALKMLHFVRSHSDKQKVIGIAMGEEGKPTRILAPIAGSFLTYAAIATEGSSAPGQLYLQQLQQIYHFRTLNRETKIYCLIGDPIDKSIGDVIHNAVFEDAKLNAIYIKICVKTNEIKDFFTLAKQLPFCGYSVTTPHKEAVIPFLIQPQLIGSCNTIKVANGIMIGYTTDGIGALDAIERRTAVFGKHLVFVGAGGAAKSMVWEAKKRGAFVTVINRTPQKAIKIASAVSGRGGGWELFPQVCKMGYDAIINCTPDGDLIEEKWILPEKIAMDIVYAPKNTAFLIKAAQKKCQLVFGYEMFIGQALQQERIWFQDQIDFDRAYKIIEEKVTSLIT